MISRDHNPNPVIDARPRWKECMRFTFDQVPSASGMSFWNVRKVAKSVGAGVESATLGA